MPVNNEIYNDLAETWWDEKGMLHLLSVLNVARFTYFKEILLGELAVAPNGLRVLDVGCGGGLLAEEFAGLDFEVTGIDPSAPSIETAKVHAAKTGLSIDYRTGIGEDLPFDDNVFDIVYCCDVLEHMSDWRQGVSEAARVLKTDGWFLYDTLNRALPSRLMTKMLQDWTGIMPPNTHVWKMFIKPEELVAAMTDTALSNQETVGLGPTANIARMGWEFLQVLLGKQVFAESFAKMKPSATQNKSVMYMGYARKTIHRIR